MGNQSPQRVAIGEFQGNLAAYLRQASQGASFLVMSDDEVLAEIRPPVASTLTPRRPGALRGRIKMADDFDELPEDVLDLIEHGDV